MTTVEPVEDWAEDFELFDPSYINDPAPVWKRLRETGCPFARTERRQVSYLPVTFDGVRSIAKDSETWSSFSISVPQAGVADCGQKCKFRSQFQLLINPDPSKAHRPVIKAPVAPSSLNYSR